MSLNTGLFELSLITFHLSFLRTPSREYQGVFYRQCEPEKLMLELNFDFMTVMLLIVPAVVLTMIFCMVDKKQFVRLFFHEQNKFWNKCLETIFLPPLPPKKKKQF